MTRLPIVSAASAASEFSVPEYLYLRLSSSNICNFRCKHCHIWQNRDPRNSLDTARRLELLREFAQLRPGGMVEFPGGEVTLALDELCLLANTANRLGLRAGIVTNGSMVRVPRIAERLARSGLERICVSLDSHRAELHDFLRGVPGAFQQAVRALRLLRSARNATAYRRHGLRIQAVTVVFDQNIEELGAFVEYCRELGVDELSLQLLNRTFANQNLLRDSFFEQHFWHDARAKAAAKAALRRVVTRYADDPLLRTRLSDLPRLERYIDEPDALLPSAGCQAHRRNLIIDSDGEVSFCFDRPEGVVPGSVGNARVAGLSELLAGTSARSVRQSMKSCRKSCGGLECHRDSELRA